MLQKIVGRGSQAGSRLTEPRLRAAEQRPGAVLLISRMACQRGEAKILLDLQRADIDLVGGLRVDSRNVAIPAQIGRAIGRQCPRSGLADEPEVAIAAIIDERGGDLGVVARTPLQLALHTEFLRLLVAGAKEQVARPTLVLALAIDRDAPGNGIAQPCRSVELDRCGVVVAIAECHVGVRFERRFLGDDRDQSAGDVAAVERPLRSLEDLDPLDVVERGDAHSGVREVESVDVDCVLSFVESGAGRAHTAQEQVVATRRLGDQPRNECWQIEDVFDIERLQRLRCQRDDRAGYLLEIDRAAGGGHDDVLQAGLGGVVIGRRGGRRSFGGRLGKRHLGDDR